MAEYLTVDEQPELRSPTMIVAFRGWPDAGEVASGSMRYLLRKLRTQKFASIDPEEFYDFTEARPTTRLRTPWQRDVRWPRNEFHYYRRRGEGSDFVLFLGREPNLRWRTYIGIVLDLAEQCGVQRLVSLGGTFDQVSHNGDPKVSGTAMEASLRRAMQGLGLQPSRYEGPTSVHSALAEACQKRGLPAGSLWGHAPHYLQAAPNVKVCYGMLRKLSALLDLTVDLEELRGAAHALELRVERLLVDNAELREYVRQLDAGELPAAEEAETETDEGPPPEIPSPEAVVRELEEFLRQQQRRPDDDPPQS
ncbi:MAG TPA: PAC2 family protein [Chloroflexota bacterium]|jgi:proteasome assembly chaperone (PAC2) family protein